MPWPLYYYFVLSFPLSTASNCFNFWLMSSFFCFSKPMLQQFTDFFTRKSQSCFCIEKLAIIAQAKRSWKASQSRKVLSQTAHAQRWSAVLYPRLKIHSLNPAFANSFIRHINIWVAWHYSPIKFYVWCFYSRISELV